MPASKMIVYTQQECAQNSHSVLNDVIRLVSVGMCGASLVSFLISSSSLLQETRTTIKARMGSKFGMDHGIMSYGLALLARLEKSP